MKIWKTNKELPIIGIGKECLIETNDNEVYLCNVVYDSQMDAETIPFYFYTETGSFLLNDIKRWCYIDDIKT